MVFLEQVSIDAKNEFYLTFIEVISSIKKHEDYKSFKKTYNNPSPKISNNTKEDQLKNVLNDVFLTNGQDSEDYSFTKKIVDVNISLVCSDDVYDLLNQLFGNSVMELGFMNFNRIENILNRQSKGIVDDYNLPKLNEVFMIRPTFRDSYQLSKLIQTRHTDVIRVVCLPEISEMYPEILSTMLGKNFTVCKYDSNTPYTTNLVELFPCAIHMVPVDGILSMVMSNCFSDFYLNGDPTVAWFFAKAFEYLQKKHLGGAIFQVVGLGVLSKYVIELLLKNRREIAANLIVDGIDKVQNEKCFIPVKLLENYHQQLVHDCTDALESGSEVGGSGSSKGFNDLETRVLLGNSPTFKASIIIDRKVDLITPMCTNFTYEGLLDSIFGLSCNNVSVDSHVLDGKVVSSLDLMVDFQKTKQKQNYTKKTIPLDSQLYDEIRWLDFSKVGSFLHEKALRVKKGYEGGGMQTIGEMGEFVKKFKSLQQEHVTLSTHVNIMGYLNSLVKSERFQLIQNVEDCILQGSLDGNKDDSRLANISKLWTKKTGDPLIAQILDLIFWNTELSVVYRLIILLSQTLDGLKQADFNTIKKAIVYQYGFVHLKTLQNFTKCGLIKLNNVSDNLRWQRMCSKFNLLVDTEYSKSDCSGIFGGYAPLSIRIAQLINVTNDCGPLNSEFALLNSQIVSTKQKSLNYNTNFNLNASFSNHNNQTQAQRYQPNQTQNESKENSSSSLFGKVAKTASLGSSGSAVVDGSEAQGVDNCLLCYVGGITLGEVAAISLLNSFNKSSYLVLATDVINTNHLINM